jgi:hypothetical protein
MRRKVKNEEERRNGRAVYLGKCQTISDKSKRLEFLAYIRLIGQIQTTARAISIPAHGLALNLFHQIDFNYDTNIIFQKLITNFEKVTQVSFHCSRFLSISFWSALVSFPAVG